MYVVTSCQGAPPFELHNKTRGPVADPHEELEKWHWCSWTELTSIGAVTKIETLGLQPASPRM
jgi:hypothetical protein